MDYCINRNIPDYHTDEDSLHRSSPLHLPCNDLDTRESDDKSMEGDNSSNSSIWSNGIIRSPHLEQDDDSNSSNTISFDSSKHENDYDLDQPTVITLDGTKKWYLYGDHSPQLHHDGDQPAVITSSGSQCWYWYGILHRGQVGQIELPSDRPAIIGSSGIMGWYYQGKLHRDHDRPAFIGADGSQYWFKYGVKHRDHDQPAVIKANGDCEWWQDGHQLSRPL